MSTTTFTRTANNIRPAERISNLLSLREKEVLQLLSEGKTSKQIGDELFLSSETIKSHRKNILKKTNVKNTTELVISALRMGWI